MFTPHQLQRDLIQTREAELARTAAARRAVHTTPGPTAAAAGSATRPLRQPGWWSRLLRRRTTPIRPSAVDG